MWSSVVKILSEHIFVIVAEEVVTDKSTHIYFVYSIELYLLVN